MFTNLKGGECECGSRVWRCLVRGCCPGALHQDLRLQLALHLHIPPVIHCVWRGWIRWVSSLKTILNSWNADCVHVSWWPRDARPAVSAVWLFTIREAIKEKKMENEWKFPFRTLIPLPPEKDISLHFIFFLWLPLACHYLIKLDSLSIFMIKLLQSTHLITC